MAGHALRSSANVLGGSLITGPFGITFVWVPLLPPVNRARKASNGFAIGGGFGFGGGFGGGGKR